MTIKKLILLIIIAVVIFLALLIGYACLIRDEILSSPQPRAIPLNESMSVRPHYFQKFKFEPAQYSANFTLSNITNESSGQLGR
jgi:hypothetical protein